MVSFRYFCRQYRAIRPRHRDCSVGSIYACYREVVEGRLDCHVGQDVSVVEGRVAVLLGRLRLSLLEIDAALLRLINGSSGQRHADLIKFKAQADELNAPFRRCVEAACGPVHEQQFPCGIKYVAASYNRDGRMLPLVDRVRGLIMEAMSAGMSSRWLATMSTATDEEVIEALSSLSLVQEAVPAEAGTGSASCSSESIAHEASGASRFVVSGRADGFDPPSLSSSASAAAVAGNDILDDFDPASDDLDPALHFPEAPFSSTRLLCKVTRSRNSRRKSAQTGDREFKAVWCAAGREDMVISWEPASAFQTDDNFKAFEEYLTRTRRANAAGEQLKREERRKALREGRTGTSSCSASGAGTGPSEATSYY
jgi:hypothetical protein